MSTKMSQGAVVDPGQSQEVVGEALPAWPKLSGADTGGAAFVFIGTLGPGSLVPPHTHSREDEITYILEGTMSVELGEELVQAAAGAVVWKPRGQRCPGPESRSSLAGCGRPACRRWAWR